MVQAYDISQIRRRGNVIEESFGWLRTVAPLRKLRHRGVCKVESIFMFACAAYERTAQPAIRQACKKGNVVHNDGQYCLPPPRLLVGSCHRKPSLRGARP
jgi:hypothetical protein